MFQKDIPTQYGLVFQVEMEVNGSSDAAPVTSICVRAGCNNPAIESKEWDREYCSNECVATHCRCVTPHACMLLLPREDAHPRLCLCLSETCSRPGAPSGIRRWRR